jgi:hypothetical protein
MIAKLQRRFLRVVTVLLALSIVSLLAVLPGILLDKSPGAMPVQAASGAFLGILIHMALFAYLYGYRLSKRMRSGKKEISLGTALAFVFLGLIIMDGGFAFLDDVPYVAYGMFVCIFSDFTAALVSFAALIVFRPKKTK